MGESSLVRAAASSIASGRPSSRRQISATSRPRSSVSSKAGSTARARAAKSRTASFAASSSNADARVRRSRAAAPDTRARRDSRSGARLVARTSRRGSRGEQLGDEGRAAEELLEVVEHEQHAVRRRSRDASVQRARRPPRRPSAWAIVASEQRRVRERREVDEGRAVAQARARARRPRRARGASCRVPPGPSASRGERRRAQERRDRGDLEAAADERRRRGRQQRRFGRGWAAARRAQGRGGALRARAPGARAPGSTPSSSTSVSAPPGRPRAPPSAGRERYSARMCCSRKRSRYGCSAIRRSSSATSASCRPQRELGVVSELDGLQPRSSSRSALGRRDRLSAEVRRAAVLPRGRAPAADPRRHRPAGPRRARAAHARRAARTARDRARPARGRTL